MSKARIYIFTPYCHGDEGVPHPRGKRKPGWDLGAAVNRHMDLVPKGAWALILDHDIAFSTDTWFRLCEDAIAAYPDAGMFTCKTNRMGNLASRAWQRCGPGNCHDMEEIRKYGSARESKPGLGYTDITSHRKRFHKRPAAGFFLLISKDVWDAFGGKVVPGVISVDRFIHRWITLRSRKKVYCIENLFVYHWCRGKPTIPENAEQ